MLGDLLLDELDSDLVVQLPYHPEEGQGPKRSVAGPLTSLCEPRNQY